MESLGSVGHLVIPIFLLFQWVETFLQSIWLVWNQAIPSLIHNFEAFIQKWNSNIKRQ